MHSSAAISCSSWPSTTPFTCAASPACSQQDSSRSGSSRCAHLLQRRIERLVYGNRSDPYVAIARLGERLQAAPDPDRVLETIVDDVTGALRLGYCAVALRRDGRLEVAAERGRPSARPRRSSCRSRTGRRHRRLIAEPAPKSELSATDQRLLEDLARQAGVAVHGVRVMADLQRSRESLVVAREEERLRSVATCTTVSAPHSRRSSSRSG